MKLYLKGVGMTFCKIIIGFFLLLFSPFIWADDGESLQSEMKNFLQQQKIPGAAVLVYRQGKVHAYYFGVSNIRSSAPVNGQTIFELGSLTKTFTGLLLAEEINRGALTLNDQVASLLKTPAEISPDLAKINLLELATHASSLPYDAPHIPYNAKATSKMHAMLWEFLKAWRAPYPSGTQTLYSNFGFGLLGIILSEKENKPLAQLMREKILLPLNMRHSGLKVLPKNYAEGYAADGKPARSPQAGLLGGAWAMKSSADDIQNYLKAALQSADTPPEIRKAFRLTEIPQVSVSAWGSDLGLGWIVTPLQKISPESLMHAPAHHSMLPKPVQKIVDSTFVADSLIDKSGATDGFRAYMGLLPSQQVGIVIMINRYISDSGALQNEGRKILFQISRGAP